MCDYSLESIATVQAQVGDRLLVTNFGTGTTGFSYGNPDCAVCCQPGTEIAFDEPIKYYGPFGNGPHQTATKVAVFRQFNNSPAHRDALEVPDDREIRGIKVITLTRLVPNQTARVLQVPAVPHGEKREEPVVIERRSRIRFTDHGIEVEVVS